MNYLKFSHENLSLETITNLVSSPKCGAISVFVGTTRDNFDGKFVNYLEYEAYETMGIKAMEEICIKIREKWPEIKNIAIYHRLGTVPVQEASIIIAISSPHRTDALQATEYCIDNVKKTVTVWKKETYTDLTSEWKENKESEPKPKKIKTFSLDYEPNVEIPNVPSHHIQVKASKADLNKRIENFMERKRNEINVRNIKTYCYDDRNSEYICARVDAILCKRKDSKSHLEINRVLNTYHRDQFNSDYLRKYIPPNGIEERLQNLETQLSLTTPVPKTIYKRLQNLEERMLYLESISPEYANFWDKNNLPNTSHKKIFTLSEIDNLIFDLEMKCEEK